MLGANFDLQKVKACATHKSFNIYAKYKLLYCEAQVQVGATFDSRSKLAPPTLTLVQAQLSSLKNSPSANSRGHCILKVEAQHLTKSQMLRLLSMHSPSHHLLRFIPSKGNE